MPILVSLATIMESHRLGDLNDRNVFLTVLEAEMFKIKVPAQSGSVESQLPCLLCLHLAGRKAISLQCIFL